MMRERVLVHAPLGRDAAVAIDLLRGAQITAVPCDDLAGIPADLRQDAAAAILTEEAFHLADVKPLLHWIETQPPWSDFPFIVLSKRGGGPERNPALARLSAILGNVIFVERPFHPETLISVVRNALRGRRRQYQARDFLEDLRDGEERLSTALRAGKLGTWELAIGTRQLNASPLCKAFFGRAPNEPFSYEELIASVSPADRERVRDAVAHSIETGDDYFIDHGVVWPDASTHWVETRARIVTGRGEPRMIGLAQDITAKKHAEAELLRFSGQLEQLVEERTAQLRQNEEKLRQAQKMEAIGQLTGGVAHDFNNLLAAILGNLDLLRKRLAGTPQLERYIDGATEGAKRGAALTQRLLAFARRQDLKPEPVDLGQLVGGMRSLIERSLGPFISVKTALSDDLPPAVVDANQLELAILNLVVNSRDAMPAGGDLRIALERALPPTALELPPGAYLRLSVTDTGMGMDAATLKSAIEPFFSTKELGKGTGLGLSMVHGLAIQLGGKLHITSAVGIGTTAELWLPASSVPVQPADTIAAEPVEAPASTILFVDDDFLIAMSTVDMLEDLGHTVIEANSAREALDILNSGRHVDAIITDHAMPGMTGVELADRARALRPGLPVLLATGYADLPAGVISDLPRLGKPYQQHELSAKLSMILTASPRHGGEAS